MVVFCFWTSCIGKLKEPEPVWNVFENSEAFPDLLITGDVGTSSISENEAVLLSAISDVLDLVPVPKKKEKQL